MNKTWATKLSRSPRTPPPKKQKRFTLFQIVNTKSRQRKSNIKIPSNPLLCVRGRRLLNEWMNEWMNEVEMLKRDLPKINSSYNSTDDDTKLKSKLNQRHRACLIGAAWIINLRSMRVPGKSTEAWQWRRVVLVTYVGYINGRSPYRTHKAVSVRYFTPRKMHEMVILET